MEHAIDVHNTQHKFSLALASLERDPAISARNKKLLKQFVWDCRLGKATWSRGRRVLSLTRCESLIIHLKKFIRFTRKDLDKVTMSDVEHFVVGLVDDAIRSEATAFGGQGGGRPLSESYKRDLKISVRKFYTYLWGERGTPPELVAWLDTRPVHTEVEALSLHEVKTVLAHCTRPQHRALVQMLFDGGFRIGELLNVRLSDVWLGQIDRHDPQKRCFFVRVRHSKTTPRTVSIPMEDSTLALQIWLKNHPARPTLGEDGFLDAEDLSKPLFPLSGNGARMIIRRLGKRAIGKRLYPHLLRHTSATYWAEQGLPEFRMKKRFGWTMASSMLHRYIDRAGIREWEVGDVYYGERDNALTKENEALRRELADLRLETASEAADKMPDSPQASGSSVGRIRNPSPQARTARAQRRTAHLA